MKITELVKALKDALQKYGDVQVQVFDLDGSPEPVGGIVYPLPEPHGAYEEHILIGTLADLEAFA